MFWLSPDRALGPPRAAVPPGRRRDGPPVRRRRTGLPAAVLGLVAAACSGCAGSASAENAGAYTIGLVSSRTGTAGQLGVGELNGAALAVARINAAGGVHGHRLVLRTADDQSNPAQTVLATRRMLNRVDAVIGPSVAGSCNAAAPLATSADRIDYCLSPGIRPQPGSTTWSSSADTGALAQRLVHYWQARGVTRIGLLSTTDASGMNGAEAVRKAVAKNPGTRLTGAASYDPDAISITPQLQSATGGHPQALIVWASGAAAGVAFKGLTEAGNTLPVATTDANLTYTFMKRIADYAPKTLLIPATRDFWGTAGGASAPLVRGYRNAYRSRYGQWPDFGPGVAYDAVRLVAQALGNADGHPAAAVDALSRLRSVHGVLGTYSFSAADHRGLTVDDVAIVRATSDGFGYAGR